MKYKVADFIIEIIIPEHLEYDALLPSFTPFKYIGGEQEETLCCFDATHETLTEKLEERILLDEATNESGIVKVWALKEGYLIESKYNSTTGTHAMVADKGFRMIKAAIIWTDMYVGQILSTMIRIAFSQAILPHKGINIHASAISHNGKAYLFMGKSGTGKSTHAALWLQHIEDTELINDDNPTVRVIEEKTLIYGTPWSGKTQCYKNICRPLGGIVRLQQAPYNRFEPSDAMGAFIALMPGCAIIKQDRRLYNSLCDTLTIIAEREHIGIMKCLPDEDAAKTCREGLMFLPPKGCRNKKKH